MKTKELENKQIKLSDVVIDEQGFMSVPLKAIQDGIDKIYDKWNKFLSGEKEGLDVERDYRDKIRRYPWFRLLSFVMAIAAIFIFISTQDINQNMIFADRWTIMHIAIVAITIILAAMSSKLFVPEDEEYSDKQYISQKVDIVK